jgi:membrane-associated phospholipid phosphatase
MTDLRWKQSRNAARAAVTVLMTCQALALPLRAGAQVGSADANAKTLFTWRDAALAGGFVVLTVAMFPVDRSLATRLQDSSTQASHVTRNAARSVQFIADPGSLFIGAGLYAVGRITKWQNVADLGLHGTEAVILSGAITGVLKDLAGRARPNVTADTNPHDFGFGRGFRGGAYQSFPSGHATAAFAAASAVTSESRRWWPHEQWVVATVMYGGATLVGLSRMYNNAHWASDVALGAGIGTFSGIKVVRYSHTHPKNFIDRALLHVSVAPSSTGETRVAWTTEW